MADRFASLEDKINMTAMMAKLNMQKLSSGGAPDQAAPGSIPPAAGPGSIPPASSAGSSSNDKQWKPGWDQPSPELAEKFAKRNPNFDQQQLDEDQKNNSTSSSATNNKTKKKKKKKNSKSSEVNEPTPTPDEPEKVEPTPPSPSSADETMELMKAVSNAKVAQSPVLRGEEFDATREAPTPTAKQTSSYSNDHSSSPPPAGAVTPPLDGSDEEEMLYAAGDDDEDDSVEMSMKPHPSAVEDDKGGLTYIEDQQAGVDDGVYEDQYNTGDAPFDMDSPDEPNKQTQQDERGGSKKSTVRRTDALFYEAERRQVNIEEQRRAEKQNLTFMPTLTAKRHPTFKDETEQHSDQVYDRLYADANKRSERHDQKVKKMGHLDPNCTFSPLVEQSAKSLKSNSQNVSEPLEGMNRPRHEVLYEDSKVRLERRRLMEEENLKRNPPPPPIEDDFDPEAEVVSRKYNPDRTEALYQDAKRRRESQKRIRDAEELERKKKFVPNIKASSRNVPPPVQAGQEDQETTGPSLHGEASNDGGQKSTSSSGSNDYRFDQLYADAARRKDVATLREKQKNREHTFQPSISDSQKNKTGGVGGDQRFAALYDEATQREAKLKTKQLIEETEYKKKHFQPSANANSAQLVEEAIRSGTRVADSVERLYQSSKMKDEDEAKQKKKAEIESSACTFKPTIYSAKSHAKSEKQKELDNAADEAKARYDKLYEDSVNKQHRQNALHKKVSEEKYKECTFQPKKISKSSPPKASKNAWEPKTESPSKKRSPNKSPVKKKSPHKDEEEDIESLPAHERLFKKAKDSAQKRSEEHNKRAFLSEDHTFQPRLRKSSDNVGGRYRSPKKDSSRNNSPRTRTATSPLGPRAATKIEGSTHSASVAQVVDEVKSRSSAVKRAGSPFAGHASSLASTTTSAIGKSTSNESRFEALYQHGVQRGLVKLSAQNARERDLDAREMSECTFTPTTYSSNSSPRLYKGPLSQANANKKKNKTASPSKEKKALDSIPPAPPRGTASPSSDERYNSPSKKKSTPKKSKNSPSKTNTSPISSPIMSSSPSKAKKNDGENDLQSRVEELLTRRKKRQQEREETIKMITSPQATSPLTTPKVEEGTIEEEEARGLFNAYDSNGDGVLDMDEFTTYLTSVFEALSHTADFQAHGVTPEEMAIATASECFAEADANNDGLLTFEEFKAWFQQAPKVIHATDEGIIDENEAKCLFEAYDTNGDGVLDMDEFTTYLTSVFQAIADTPEFQAHGASPKEVAEATAHECFAEADENGDGLLTFDEFKEWFKNAPHRGVTPLHLSEEGTIEEQEARDLFNAYDANGDGVLDIDEFRTYLISVFEAIEHTPEFEVYNSTPEDVADATVEDCFNEADADMDGLLTFDEFKQWFKNAPGRPQTPLHLTEEGFIEEEEARELFNDYDTNGDGILDIDEFVVYLTSVFEALADTPEFQAHNATPKEVADFIAEDCFNEADANGDGELSYDEFKQWYLKDPTRRSSLSTITMIKEEDEEEEEEEEQQHVHFNLGKDNNDHEDHGDNSASGHLRHKAETVLWQAAGMVDIQNAKDLKRRADFKTSFTSSVEWWLEIAPKFCGEGCRGPHVIASLARGAISACNQALDIEINNPKKIPKHLDQTSFTNTFISYLHMLKALGHLLEGDAMKALSECDESLKVDDLGIGPGKFKGFVWGLKAMILYSCKQDDYDDGDDKEVALVSLLRANQLNPQKSKLLSSTLEKVLNEEDIDVMSEFNNSSSSFSSSSSSSQLNHLNSNSKSNEYISADSDIDMNNNGSEQYSSRVDNSSMNESSARELFFAYDSNHDGVLDLQEFTTYLTSVFESLAHTPEFQENGITPEEMAIGTAEQCFAEADADHDGYLTFEEFTNWFQNNDFGGDGDDYFDDEGVAAGEEGDYIEEEISIEEQEARDLFNAYDVNGDGVLDIEEFKNYLITVFQALANSPEFQSFDATPQELADATCQQVFKKADADGDGALDFIEFRDWFQNAPARLAEAGDEYEYDDDDDFMKDEEYIPMSHTQSDNNRTQVQNHSNNQTSSSEFAQTSMNSTMSRQSSASSPRTTQPLTTTTTVVGATPQEVASAVANKVAEVRFRMREIFKEELAAVTLDHEEEMNKLREQLATKEQQFQNELDAAQAQFDNAMNQATNAFTQEKKKLMGQIDFHIRSKMEKEEHHARELERALEQQRKEHKKELDETVSSLRSALEDEVNDLKHANLQSLRRIESITHAHAAIHDQLVDMKGNIRVIARLRPHVTKGISVATRSSPFEITLSNKTTTSTYSYDQVMGPTASQEQCFECVKPLVQSALDGRNVCLLAYGQTGSGKTHTLVGQLPSMKEINHGNGIKVNEGCGVMPRTVIELFEKKDINQSVETAVYLSVLEIYNETVRDLLVDPDPSQGPPRVDLRVTQNGVEVPNAMELEVPDAATTLEILAIANENRATAATDVNAHSSRSHLVVTLRIVSKSLASFNDDGSPLETGTKIQLVDLAGCERTKTSNVSGLQLTEATAINKSLSALGDVVSALANNKAGGSSGSSSKSKASSASKFIPYRNSKLTLLLQDALQADGKSKVVLFVTTRPELNNWNESVSALTFASRCRAIDLYSGSTNMNTQQLTMGQAATEAELQNANKKIQQLEFKLRAASSL
jgi:Ca2+-binding EF-hand superfamily protein